MLLCRFLWIVVWLRVSNISAMRCFSHFISHFQAHSGDRPGVEDLQF